MKTRKCSLPLVILAAILCGSTVSAQEVAHIQLFGYFAKMPAPLVFPVDAELSTANPNSFEDNDDLNATQLQLQNLTKGTSHSEIEADPTTNVMMKSSPGRDGVIIAKETIDSLEAALKDLQSVKIEFNANFRRLEELYNKNIDKANEAANERQRKEPCDGNTNCLLKHISALNKDIIATTKKKVLNEQYLLSVYQTQAKPSFQRIDNLLQRANYGERVISTEVKNLIRGAQQNQIMFLNEIIEHLKLQRITISNCAKLAQQGYHGK